MEATGLYRGSIPGSGPAANTDDMSSGGQSQCIMRTILRTKSSSGSYESGARTSRASKCEASPSPTLLTSGHPLADTRNMPQMLID